MCFGGQTVSAPSNPAPYTLGNSQSAVTETATPSPAAASATPSVIEQDKGSASPGLNVTTPIGNM